MFRGSRHGKRFLEATANAAIVMTGSQTATSIADKPRFVESDMETPAVVEVRCNEMRAHRHSLLDDDAFP